MKEGKTPKRPKLKAGASTPAAAPATDGKVQRKKKHAAGAEEGTAPATAPAKVRPPAAAAPAAAAAGGKLRQPAAAGQQGEQQQQQQQAGAKSKKRKRKASTAVDESSLTHEERERRRRQRELRELALKLRAQGQKYNPKRARRQTEREKQQGHKPRRAVQVIIIPIYWQKRKEEMELVLEAAERAQQLLRDGGVKADTDTTTQRTPGQKYRYWEERGVQLRVELGPKEAAAGRCVLAHCHTPGEVAEKEGLVLGPALLAAVRAALGMPASAAGGETEPAAGGSEGSGATGGSVGKKAGQQAGKKTQQQEAEQGGPGAPAGQQHTRQPSAAAAAAAARAVPALAQQAKPAIVGSGDALEDDFVGLEVQDEPAAGRKGKKGKRKAGGAAPATGADAEGLHVLLAGPDGEGGGKKKKAPKLVTF